MLGAGATLVIAILAYQYMGYPSGIVNTGSIGAEGVNVTLLANAGVMIEADDLRIYIDPIDLPSEYRDMPADAILITHDHGDQYRQHGDAGGGDRRRADAPDPGASGLRRDTGGRSHGRGETIAAPARLVAQGCMVNGGL